MMSPSYLHMVNTSFGCQHPAFEGNGLAGEYLPIPGSVKAAVNNPLILPLAPADSVYPYGSFIKAYGGLGK